MRVLVVFAVTSLLSLAPGAVLGQDEDVPAPETPEAKSQIRGLASPGAPTVRPDPDKPKPLPRNRWAEDWSVNWEPASLIDEDVPPAGKFWRPLKYIPLDESEESYLSLGGEARLAYEFYDDKDFGISDIGYQDAWQLRLALHADLHLNERWRVFTQIGYGTLLDNREGGEKVGDECDPNLWEAFVDYRIQVETDERVVIRLGRQLIEEGGDLFITAGEGANVRQSYDGLRVAWLEDQFIKAEAFAAEYVDFEDDPFGMAGKGEHFWGLKAGFRLSRPELDVHLFYAGWDLKDRPFEQSGGVSYDEQRHSLVLWLDRPLDGEHQLGLSYYLAYQFGEYDEEPKESDIRAFAGFGALKYALYQELNTPILGLKTAYFSGDDDPDDDELNTFYNPFFGVPFFGYGRDIMPYNLIFIEPNIGYQFGGQDLLLTLSHGFYWRADKDDAFYAVPTGITAPAGVSNSSSLGQQTQLSVRYLVNPHLLLSSYLARFFAGDVIEDAGGDDRDFFHIGLHYLF